MAKRKSAPPKITMPARSNKGGAVRGQARAKQVQAMNATRKAMKPKAPAPAPAQRPAQRPAPPSLPFIPQDLRLPVPQIELFRAIGERLREVTSR